MIEATTLIKFLSETNGSLEFATDKDGRMHVVMTAKETDPRYRKVRHSISKVISETERKLAFNCAVSDTVSKMYYDLVFAINEHRKNNHRVGCSL